MKILKTYPGDSHFHLFQQVIETVYPSNMHRPESAESVNTDFLEECVVVLDDEIPVARTAL
ncbi:MAG: hypothetical protein OEW75_13555, partial [Cyclobacteriaceae bacterium]|nr:hypothetical protein [Cyclobacteriaceae bacterium]